MNVFFLGEKGLRLSGSLWELCLIAACEVNYEVRFERAAWIALWGTAASRKLRRNNTAASNKGKAAHTDSRRYLDSQTTEGGKRHCSSH